MSADVPKVKLGRLYEKVSAAGRTYYVGRLGSARLLVFKSREVTEDGTAVWDVFVQQVEDKPEARPIRASGELPFVKSARPTRLLPRHDVGSFHDDPLDDVLP